MSVRGIAARAHLQRSINTVHHSQQQGQVGTNRIYYGWALHPVSLPDAITCDQTSHFVFAYCKISAHNKRKKSISTTVQQRSRSKAMADLKRKRMASYTLVVPVEIQSKRNPSPQLFSREAEAKKWLI